MARHLSHMASGGDYGRSQGDCDNIPAPQETPDAASPTSIRLILCACFHKLCSPAPLTPAGPLEPRNRLQRRWHKLIARMHRFARETWWWRWVHHPALTSCQAALPGRRRCPSVISQRRQVTRRHALFKISQASQNVKAPMGKARRHRPTLVQSPGSRLRGRPRLPGRRGGGDA